MSDKVITCKSCGVEYSGNEGICPQCGTDGNSEVKAKDKIDALNLRSIRSSIKSVKTNYLFEDREVHKAAKYVSEELKALEDYVWKIRNNLENPKESKPLSTVQSDKAKLERLAFLVSEMTFLLPGTKSTEVVRTVADVQGLLKKIEKFIFNRVSKL